MAKLKDICDVDWGNTSLTKSAYIDDGKYLGVSAAGCDGRMGYYDFDAYTPVISAIGANCGKLFLPEEPFVAIKNTITLKPHDGLDGKYLYYALVNNRIPKRGGGQPFIGKGDTEEYEITVPDIGTQLEIVKKVEQICRIISYREREIDKLDELIKARFVEMFGHGNHRVVKASEVCDFITKGTTPPSGEIKEEYADGMIPFLKVYNLSFTGQMLFDDTPQYILKETHNGKLARSKVYPNDVLMNIVGPPLGKFAFVTDEFEEWNINQAIAIFRAKEHILPRFLLHALMQPTVLEPFIGQAVGIRQQNLSLEQCRNLQFPLPALEEQKAFVKFVEQLDKSKSVIQKSLNETQLLFDSLMQTFFE